jgi:hypothetical protein
VRHPGITNAAAQARRSDIIAAFAATGDKQAIAAQFGISPRYVLMVARDADLSRPRGRPATLSQRVSISEWRGPPKIEIKRGGYALQATERSAAL